MNDVRHDLEPSPPICLRVNLTVEISVERIDDFTTLGKSSTRDTGVQEYNIQINSVHVPAS